MRTVLVLTLVLAAPAIGDEAWDRAAIAATIARLNDLRPRPGIFTDDAEGKSTIDRLREGKPYRIRVETGAETVEAAGVRVAISHEPWGEATILRPGMNPGLAGTFDSPRVERGAIRFVTSDVALAEGSFVYLDKDGAEQTKPLLFVMKRDEAEWRTASLRVLSQERL